MRGHVIVPFGSVDEERVTVWNKTLKEFFQIAPDIRIGIFLNQQGRGGMAQMQREQPILRPLFSTKVEASSVIS